MSAVAVSTRRFAVLAGDRTVDLAASGDESLAAALATAAVKVDTARHALVLSDGSQLSAHARVSDLDDGALVILIDLEARADAVLRTDRERREPSRAAWWLLATTSALASALALAALAAGTAMISRGVGLTVGAAMAAGALTTGVLWSRRSDDGSAAAPTATLLLAFGSAAIAVPNLAGGAHLALTLGLGAAGILFTAVAIGAAEPRVRGMATTLATLLVLLAAIWGAALVGNWGIGASAALTLGLMAPAWRVLPQLFLDLPGGWSLHYRAFMTSRWTVRGAVPEDPGPVTMPAVRGAVETAGARLVAAIALLAGMAVLSAPVLLAGLGESGTVVRIAALALLGLTVIHLLLAPRHATSPALRWIARTTAAILLVEGAVAAATAGLDSASAAGAGLLLVFGTIAAAAIVPVARGVRSVAWSRAADVIETLAVALVPAAALLAADALELIRRAMAA